MAAASVAFTLPVPADGVLLDFGAIPDEAYKEVLFADPVGLTLYEALLLVPTVVPGMVLMPVPLPILVFRLAGAVPEEAGPGGVEKPVPEAEAVRVG